MVQIFFGGGGDIQVSFQKLWKWSPLERGIVGNFNLNQWSMLFSVTGFCNFWKKIDIKFITKVVQIFSVFEGYFEKYDFYVKTVVATFWATIENIGSTF